MRGKVLLRSFAGGEITPELFGRVELAKFQTGLLKARNFITLPHGPATRRPGTHYINQAFKSASQVRLLAFEYNVDQTLVIELGDRYMRFHTRTGTVLEAEQLAAVSGSTGTTSGHGLATGDWIFDFDVNQYYVVTVLSPSTFTVTHLDGAPATPPGGIYDAIPGFMTFARVYTLVTPYNTSTIDLLDIHVAQSSDVMTLTHPAHQARELRRLGATNWVLAPISFAPSSVAPGSFSATATVAVNQTLTTQRYVVTTIGADISESLPSAQASCNNNLNLAGNFNTLVWGAVAGAERYNVYKLRGGIYGFIGSTTGVSLIDDNIQADTAKSPPTDTLDFNTTAGTYPSTVTYHEQRRWFAGAALKPQTIFATRTGTESNLSTSIPSQPDDAIEFRVASTQQNVIRHLSPLSDLICLTGGAEFRVYAEGAPAITLSSLTVKPTGYTGASNVQPVLTSGSVLHVQAQGSRLRELSYGGNQDNFAYKSVDLSILATHLFNGFTIRDLAYSRAPDQIAWAVRNDGTLLGMTYVPEQQVYGWHQHDTANGVFEAVATVTEGNEEVLYVVVRRTFGSRVIRTIERMASRLFTAAADAYLVDCGLTYRGAPVSELQGLRHLEGQQVDILADGAVEARQTVTGGRVTLSGPASVVHVGLPVTSDLVTLPLSLDGAAAAGQGTRKNITDVHLRVISSSLVKAGPDFNALTAYPARQVSDPYGSPPALRTSELTMMLDPSWGSDGSICVRQDQPVPLTVAAIVLEVSGAG